MSNILDDDRWIYVWQSLPGLGHKVIVLCRHRNHIPFVRLARLFTSHHTEHGGIKENFYWDVEEPELLPDRLFSITHWMPFVSPKKRPEDDDDYDDDI